MHIRSHAKGAKAAKGKFKLLAFCKPGAFGKAYFSDAQNPLSPPLLIAFAKAGILPI
jgi:hypothetical protein